MIEPFLLEILVCPEDKSPVKLADAELIRSLNQKISQGQIRNRSGQVVKEPLEQGLLRLDQKIIYPVREDIPVMLVDEGIPL